MIMMNDYEELSVKYVATRRMNILYFAQCEIQNVLQTEAYLLTLDLKVFQKQADL